MTPSIASTAESMFSETFDQLKKDPSGMLDPSKITSEQSTLKGASTVGDRSMLFAIRGLVQGDMLGRSFEDESKTLAGETPSINSASVRSSVADLSHWDSIANSVVTEMSWYLKAEGKILEDRQKLESLLQEIVALCDAEFTNGRLEHMRNQLSSQQGWPSDVTDQDLLAIDKKLFTAAVLRELRMRLQNKCDSKFRPLYPELQPERYEEARDQPSAMLQPLSRHVKAFRDKLKSDEESRKDFAQLAGSAWVHSLHLCKHFRSAGDNEASLPVDFDELAYEEADNSLGLAFYRERLKALEQHCETAFAILGPQWHSDYKKARTFKVKPML